jgi:hypothetical protein
MAARALVLGGGGVTGVAWELGVLAGLAQQGIGRYRQCPAQSGRGTAGGCGSSDQRASDQLA